MLKNQKLFGVTKAIVQNIRGIGDFVQVLNDSIELSMELQDGKRISGNLKENGLSVRQSDLARTYGAELPGEWYVMGILDYTPLQDESSIGAEIQSIENVIDQYTDLVRKFYSKSTYSIIPILIFREIK